MYPPTSILSLVPYLSNPVLNNKWIAESCKQAVFRYQQIACLPTRNCIKQILNSLIPLLTPPRLSYILPKFHQQVFKKLLSVQSNKKKKSKL